MRMSVKMVEYGPEKWFQSKKHSLLIQRAGVLFSAPTRWLTTAGNSRFGTSEALFWPLWTLHTQHL